MNSKHTPTPWFASEDGDGENYGASTLVDARNGYIASVGAPFAEVAEENLANAAFIVRAVNAHDDLVAALHEYMSQFGQALEAYGIAFTDSQKIADAKARAALARAGEP